MFAMSTALCDSEAFYPFRSLVEGPLNDPEDLPKSERFIRCVILHDELRMAMVPLPGPGEDEELEWQPEEIAAGGRNVIVAIGPVIERYQQYDLVQNAPRPEVAVDVSPDLLEIAEEFANAGAGPYFDAHVNHIRSLVATVVSGGSILCGSRLSERVVEVATRIPENLFARLDGEWAEFARVVDEGRIGLVVPPFTAILLNRCARRDAIPQVLADMRDEFRGAREAVWQLIAARRAVRTIAEANEINREFERAGALMIPGGGWPTLSPVRTLWQIGTAALGGGAVGAIGGQPAIGAAAAAINQAANIARDRDIDFRILFRRGAFDLARKVNLNLREIPQVPELLRAHLTDGELERLGIR